MACILNRYSYVYDATWLESSAHIVQEKNENYTKYVEDAHPRDANGISFWKIRKRISEASEYNIVKHYRRNSIS